MSRKTRVGILFGGRSGEHEVSIASAASVLDALDSEKYEAVPIGITREGHWLIADSPAALLQSEVVPQLPGTDEAVPDVTHHAILRSTGGTVPTIRTSAVDVVFPLMHGPYGEDGTIQGLLELADLPYVGSGVLGSAVGMDKIAMKQVFAQAGIPSVPYRAVLTWRWRDERHEVLRELEGALQYPLFVKPCNMGSSVGIARAESREDLERGIEAAARRDRRIIVEQGIEAREIECAVLGNNKPIVSVPGEVHAHGEFYDYKAKYTDGLADLIIPAKLTREQTEVVQDLARRAFLAVDAAGLARVDFFLRTDGEIIVNEINTMPGFTATSMYPRLWQVSGLPYSDLISRLIELAFERHEENRGKSVAREW